jgi:TPR repeat protein
VLWDSFCRRGRVASGCLARLALGLVAGLAVSLAMPVRADSVLTTQGLAAFSAARYADALQRWQQAAQAGDAEAALYIGLLNDLGRGVVQDAREARRWYERAAELGNAVAMFNVGVLYDAGTGVARDRARAAAWYRQAADLGMPRAAYALGLMHGAGEGVAADRDQAIRYFRQALAGGVTAARAHLAALGVANPGGTATAPGSGRDAALAAFDRAQELLLRRTPEAAKEAAGLLRQGAEKGDLLAAYNLAYCYDKGVGLPADWRLAYVWYGRAARSPVETVRTAAQAGMVSIAVRLAPEQLAEAQAMLSAGGRGQ